MSVVTDLVFVTPSRSAADRFADLFAQTEHGFFGSTPNTNSWRPVEVEDNGSKCSGTHVFHLGVNHIDPDLAGTLKAQDWPKGTILYMHCTDLMLPEDPEPEVTVW